MTPVLGAGGEALASALDSSGLSVTEFLESLALEPIDALVLSQRTVRTTMERSVLLVGRDSKRSFVFATSTIDTDLVPPEVVRRLVASTDPIGRILTDLGLAVAKETPTGTGGPVGTPSEARGAILSRSYRLVVEHEAAMEVSEWFLPAASLALGASRREPRAG